MIYLENNTQVQDVYIPRQSPITATGQPYYATTEYVDDRFDAETARTEETYAKQEELSAYTPTTGFTTINGSAITEGGNITIEGRIYSAGTNINIDEQNVISVTGLPDTQAVEGMVSSALTAYTDTAGMEQAISAATASTTGWVESQGYLTEHQSLSAYSTTDEVEGLISAATASTTGWVESQGYLTEHQSLSAYSTTDEVESMISAATAATTGWVENQGYLTEHQSLSAYSTTDEVEGMITAATQSMATRDWVNANFVDDDELDDAIDDAESYTTSYVGRVLTAYTNTTGMTAAIDASTAATTAWVETQGYITACTGGAGVEEVTQAEYDALVSGGTVDPDTMYVITDAPTIDIDDLASKRLQELDSIPSGLTDGDIINLEDGAYKYVDGSGQTGFWSSMDASSFTNNTSELGFAISFSHIPEGQQILEFRRSGSGNWKQFKMENGVLNVYDNSGSTPSTAITKNSGIVRVNSLSSSSYWIEVFYRDNYIGFYKNGSTQLQNLWDGITSTAHLEKLSIPEPVPFINANFYGIPNWNHNGEVIGRRLSIETKSMYFNTTGTSSSYRWDLFYGGAGNTPARMFVPTQSGTEGQVLTSAGNAEPTWQTMIKAVKITSDEYDALVNAGTTDANTLYLIDDE